MEMGSVCAKSHARYPRTLLLKSGYLNKQKTSKALMRIIRTFLPTMTCLFLIMNVMKLLIMIYLMEKSITVKVVHHPDLVLLQTYWILRVSSRVFLVMRLQVKCFFPFS
ncbi:hypothetical protein AQUCO_00700282v1 [Aquilegia coerulea]|uniref:Uncharacterized protein n=1 Tax=Aquilegia coerulea TaxID=218851 RepID=A0A2G5EJE7_AQUCA|nr:hypothetical protein AQUCO_00700282v1 [Aquilegia coerulea]